MRRWSAVLVTAGLLVAPRGDLAAARLKSEALDGWQRYTALVEFRRLADWSDDRRFFVMDAGPDADAERRALLRGETVVRPMEAIDSRGRSITVSGALVHHWRGAVLLKGARLPRLLDRLEQEAPLPGREVLRSAILGRGPDGMIRVFLRLQRTRFVTAVFDTEHDVQVTRLSPTRGASSSVATRIVEIDNPGTPAERARPVGDDRGFLWRLNAYWRYEAVAGGVIAECESISLSRSVPFGLHAIAAPLIGSTARESMERALEGVIEMGRGL